MQNPPGVDPEALARARYFAYAQRRTMPPRCNPFGILVLVLSLGMVFIGLTMTIIANWPGATSIGENPLKIAGPVLLAVGGAIFVLGIILVVFLNRHEQVKWERRLTNLAADRLGSSSREILVTRQAPTAADNYGAKPGGNWSLSTAGRYSGGTKDDPSQGSGSYPVKGRYSSSTVETNPDPTKKNNLAGKFYDVNLDPEDKIPDPMRIQKKKLKSGSSAGSANQSYSSGAGEADLGIPGMLMPSPKGSQQSGRQLVAYSNGGYENLDSIKITEDETNGGRRGAGRNGQKRSPEEGRHAAGISPVPIRDAIARGSAQLYPPDFQQQLRVHIKAQPGTAVHITPSATPPNSRLSYQLHPRTSLDTSGETEI